MITTVKERYSVFVFKATNWKSWFPYNIAIKKLASSPGPFLEAIKKQFDRLWTSEACKHGGQLFEYVPSKASALHVLP